jgi:hypothetical protein
MSRADRRQEDRALVRDHLAAKVDAVVAWAFPLAPPRA